MESSLRPAGRLVFIKDSRALNLASIPRDEGPGVASESIHFSGLAGRYATALYELADESRALDQVAADLVALRTMIRESDDLRRLITSPLVPRDAQARAVSALVQRAAFSDLTRRFIGLMARNRRLFSLPLIIDAFVSILAARRGETLAEIVSARALSPAQVAAVTDRLKASVGRKITVDLKVDPRLLGGLKVKVGSRLIDATLSAKLDRLQLAMKGQA